ncbi:hypothetical protein [Amycolatopsis anabasis]|uniref:hypothetical protein n=1 Tax=Amycolatopsis anabasis TaxID=1840409 RepID=UPI00131E21D5|nr:hypothetical protein [Amycolatopsis anabasis]
MPTARAAELDDLPIRGAPPEQAGGEREHVAQQRVRARADEHTLGDLCVQTGQLAQGAVTPPGLGSSGAG